MLSADRRPVGIFGPLGEFQAQHPEREDEAAEETTAHLHDVPVVDVERGMANRVGKQSAERHSHAEADVPEHRAFQSDFLAIDRQPNEQADHRAGELNGDVIPRRVDMKAKSSDHDVVEGPARDVRRHDARNELSQLQPLRLQQ